VEDSEFLEFDSEFWDDDEEEEEEEDSMIWM